MGEEFPVPASAPTPDEIAAFARLSGEDVAEIDEAILSSAGLRWLKVAMIVSSAARKLSREFPWFSIDFYTARLECLAAMGHLEVRGEVRFIRFSEARLPSSREREQARESVPIR
jgi:hypothetical protein